MVTKTLKFVFFCCTLVGCEVRSFCRWDAKRLEREAAAKAKDQQKPPVPPTKVAMYFFLIRKNVTTG